MDLKLQIHFIKQWKKYFPGAELPITFYYTDIIDEAEIKDSANTDRCLICNLNRVREGHLFIYSYRNPGCLGGKRYTGFTQSLRKNFEFFLSCGIPEKMEGERYKKSPELVKELLKNMKPTYAQGKYLVFKRWDKLLKNEEPEAVIFYAGADVLSGLFTLANYDRADRNGVVSPMGAGCASIVYFPLEESKKRKPKCILGMFDVSARPCVPENCLTFTIPFRRFKQVIDNMDESFLITGSWKKVQERIKLK